MTNNEALVWLLGSAGAILFIGAIIRGWWTIILINSASRIAGSDFRVPHGFWNYIMVGYIKNAAKGLLDR